MIKMMNYQVPKGVGLEQRDVKEDLIRAYLQILHSHRNSKKTQTKNQHLTSKDIPLRFLRQF